MASFNADSYGSYSIIASWSDFDTSYSHIRYIYYTITAPGVNHTYGPYTVLPGEPGHSIEISVPYPGTNYNVDSDIYGGSTGITWLTKGSDSAITDPLPIKHYSVRIRTYEGVKGVDEKLVVDTTISVEEGEYTEAELLSKAGITLPGEINYSEIDFNFSTNGHRFVVNSNGYLYVYYTYVDAYYTIDVDVYFNGNHFSEGSFIVQHVHGDEHETYDIEYIVKISASIPSTYDEEVTYETNLPRNDNEVTISSSGYIKAYYIYTPPITPTRPFDWSWDSNITQGAPLQYDSSTGKVQIITADEWNRFCSRINEFRVYKDMSNYEYFITVKPDDEVTADIVNRAYYAIQPMVTFSTPLPSLAVKGQPITASFFNGLKDALNDIS